MTSGLAHGQEAEAAQGSVEKQLPNDYSGVSVTSGSSGEEDSSESTGLSRCLPMFSLAFLLPGRGTSKRRKPTVVPPGNTGPIGYGQSYQSNAETMKSNNVSASTVGASGYGSPDSNNSSGYYSTVGSPSSERDRSYNSSGNSSRGVGGSSGGGSSSSSINVSDRTVIPINADGSRTTVGPIYTGSGPSANGSGSGRGGGSGSGRVSPRAIKIKQVSPRESSDLRESPGPLRDEGDEGEAEDDGGLRFTSSSLTSTLASTLTSTLVIQVPTMCAPKTASGTAALVCVLHRLYMTPNTIYTHTLIHSYTHTLILSYTHILIHTYTHTHIH